MGSVRFLGAVAVIVFDGERLLALRRGPARDSGAGLWEVVSGRVQSGEPLLQAAIREVREETGLTVRLDRRPIDAYLMTRGEDPTLLVVYRGHRLGGEFRRSEEHDAHAWCLPSEFRELTSLARLADAVDCAADGDQGA